MTHPSTKKSHRLAHFSESRGGTRIVRHLPKLLSWFLTIECLALSLFSHPAYAEQPTTRPTSDWYSKIVPWVHPQEKELSATEPYFDPAEFIDSPLNQRESAFTFLITTRIFTGPVVGAGAATSDHSRAFHTLMNLPDAKEIFLDLFQRGNDIAKLYALCALRQLEDTKAFQERIKPFSNSKTKIHSHFGCMIYECDLRTLIPDIQSGYMPRSLLYPHGRPTRTP
jgi:hypothetical protein